MAENILGLVSPAELTAFAREVPETVQNPLSGVIPNDEVNDTVVRVGKAGRKASTAQYRSYDAEAPIGKREGYANITEIELPPLSEKLPLNERLRLDLHRYKDAAAGQVVDSFFDDVISAVTSIRNRAEKARGELLSDGKVTINENSTIAEADFGLAASHKPSANWSAVGADIIADETTWKRVVERDAQESVQFAVVSPEILDLMLKNDNYRAAAFGAAGGGVLTPERLNEVRRAFGLPPVFVYDGQVPGATGMDRVIAANKYIQVTGGFGRSVWGLTAEGIELSGSNAVDFTAADAPGIVVNQWREPDPVTVWTKAASVFLPVADDINGLLSATITLA